MNWIIIGILIVLVFLFLRMKHFKGKIVAVLLIITLIFLYTTATTLLTEEEINWKTFGGVEKALRIYFSWLGNAFGNLKTISGQAIKMDWQIEKNNTIISIK